MMRLPSAVVSSEAGSENVWPRTLAVRIPSNVQAHNIFRRNMALEHNIAKR